MKNYFNQIFPALLCLLLAIPVQLVGQQKVNLGIVAPETECLGVEMDGSVTLLAWGTGRNRFDAEAQAKKNAIKDVLFKGISKGGNGCDPRPLIPEVNADKKYEDYFNAFFSDRNGHYKRFVSGKDERIGEKIVRRRYKSTSGVTCRITIRVLRSELKVKLIEDGIIN
jgi:hypothetical protein